MSMDLTETDYAPPPRDAGYPLTLPLELALGDKPVNEVFEDYGLSKEDYDRLRYDTTFLADIKRCRDELKKDGMTFRLKAKMQADHMLKRTWLMVHDAETPPTVKADLIKSVVRWAGYEQKPGTDAMAAGQSGPAFQINIIMGDG